MLTCRHNISESAPPPPPEVAHNVLNFPNIKLIIINQQTSVSIVVRLILEPIQEFVNLNRGIIALNVHNLAFNSKSLSPTLCYWHFHDYQTLFTIYSFVSNSVAVIKWITFIIIIVSMQSNYTISISYRMLQLEPYLYRPCTIERSSLAGRMDRWMAVEQLSSIIYQLISISGHFC